SIPPWPSGPIRPSVPAASRRIFASASFSNASVRPGTTPAFLAPNTSSAIRDARRNFTSFSVRRIFSHSLSVLPSTGSSCARAPDAATRRGIRSATHGRGIDSPWVSRGGRPVEGQAKPDLRVPSYGPRDWAVNDFRAHRRGRYNQGDDLARCL